MRVGIDLSVLRQRRTGIGNYAFHLSESFKNLNTEHKLILLPGPKGTIPFWSKHIGYARDIRRQGIDVLHGPANVLPLFYKGPSVITLHDLAIYKHPEWFPSGQWLATKVVVPASIKKASKIIVPSLATKKDLMELFAVPAEKIAVIPHGVEERFFKSDLRTANSDWENPARQSPVGSRYILFVGTLEPRKNLQRVIEAYRGLSDEIKKKYELWVAGGRGWGNPLSKPPHKPTPKAGTLSGDPGKGEGIKWLDYVSDEDLPGLYQNSSLFVYPSLYEGFGLPVLEAMAAGCPVVTSRQIAQNIEYRMSDMDNSIFHILYSVDPHSTEQIRIGMVEVLANPKLALKMSGQGVVLARHFTWSETARRTVEVYEMQV
ncbi:MAG: hypothetical protein A2751_00055 [Candidatus Doudnabacteria bacterium RIFCSPHIGHO2_01_FULL_46_14]|uniref:Glycosyltransferase subfamily 4-like N-terminal domain-containing protein n=1 Tax=Candidatus Doudnabacteria bacterium RIFCSPHIGHO2_01_FULL_46_14 TaxID=1817824 RepID=A0A1F5NNZ2_9BACT|nr:MAG: hypothetical protein A2751_00055 [Candidatus Doudnabacteria bacterium RIFCSPHIGHO2_01_FULL_46_14]